jgi:hypothetical protein
MKTEGQVTEKTKNLLEIVTHPAFLFVVMVIFAASFAVTRYAGIGLNNTLLSKASGDLGDILKYMGTILITHIITRFLENKKNK